MELAIVLLNYNGKNWLEKFLPSIIQHSDSQSIYVIDNASTDDSINFLRSQYPNIPIVINEKNVGFAGGYNQGLRHIEADIYCLLNTDVEVQSNWIAPILQQFQEDSNIAAIQPKILDFYQPQYFEYAGAAGGFIDNLGFPYCRGREFFNVEKDHGQYNDISPIFWASGACMFIRSKDFWSVDGFDEDYFAHMEEIDLCWRLINKGRKIMYNGNASVLHVGGGTLNKNSTKKTFLNFRNSLYTLLKNLPNDKLFIVIFQRLLLDSLAAFYFLFKNGFGHFWAVIRAHYSFYFNFSKIWKKRKAGIENYYQARYIVFKFLSSSKNQVK